jgi:hypothetical protein
MYMPPLHDFDFCYPMVRPTFGNRRNWERFLEIYFQYRLQKLCLTAGHYYPI